MRPRGLNGNWLIRGVIHGGVLLELVRGVIQRGFGGASAGSVRPVLLDLRCRPDIVPTSAQPYHGAFLWVHHRRASGSPASRLQMRYLLVRKTTARLHHGTRVRVLFFVFHQSGAVPKVVVFIRDTDPPARLTHPLSALRRRRPHPKSFTGTPRTFSGRCRDHVDVIHPRPSRPSSRFCDGRERLCSPWRGSSRPALKLNLACLALALNLNLVLAYPSAKTHRADHHPDSVPLPTSSSHPSLRSWPAQAHPG